MVIVNIVKAEGPFLGATVAQYLQTQYYNYIHNTTQNIKSAIFHYNII